MEFKDLPSDIQRIAGHTLAVALKEFGTDIKSEPAKELARNISVAFMELYKEANSLDTDNIESAIMRYVQTGNLNNRECERCNCTFPRFLLGSSQGGFSIFLLTPNH